MNNRVGAQKTLCVSAALGVTMLAVASCGGSDPLGDSTGVRVMTRNLYLGSELTDVVSSPTVADIPGRAAAVLASVRASFPADRLALVADEIAATNPDVVGLQEVTLFHIQSPSDFNLNAPAKNAGDPGAPGSVETIDFLALLHAALQQRGLDYRVGVVAAFSDVELPAQSEGGVVDVRLVDRDVILLKAGVNTVGPAAFMTFASGLPKLPIGGDDSLVTIDVVRGFERIRVQKDRAEFEVVHTHLEAGGGTDANVSFFLAGVQQGQANDLVASLKGVANPVVLLGDFNSPADNSGSTSYRTILNAGFRDTASNVPALHAALTCCTPLAADAYQGFMRIDTVFTRGRIGVQGGYVTGADATHRTPQGLFASDHAGVGADLLIENNL